MLAKTFLRRTAIAGGALVMVVAMSACVKTSSESSGDGPKLVKAGTLTVCTQLPFAPFESKDNTGKIVGFDIDWVELFASKLKLKVELIDSPFDGIKSGQVLTTGKCDLAAAGISITDERRKVMDFSTPYFNATQALLVRPGSPYKTLADLKGKRVSGQSGTVGLDYVKKNAPKYGYIPVDFKDIAAQTQAMDTKQTDASVNDLPVLALYVKEHPGKSVLAQQFDTGDKYGFTVAKGKNPKLLAAVNQYIAAAKTDGTEAKLLKKWMGITKAG